MKDIAESVPLISSFLSVLNFWCYRQSAVLLIKLLIHFFSFEDLFEFKSNKDMYHLHWKKGFTILVTWTFSIKLSKRSECYTVKLLWNLSRCQVFQIPLFIQFCLPTMKLMKIIDTLSLVHVFFKGSSF